MKKFWKNQKGSRQEEIAGKNPQQMLFAEGITTIKSLYPSDSKRERI